MPIKIFDFQVFAKYHKKYSIYMHVILPAVY